MINSFFFLRKKKKEQKAAGVPPVSRPTRPLWGLNPLEGESGCLEF